MVDVVRRRRLIFASVSVATIVAVIVASRAVLLPFVLIQGESEAAEGVVSVKDMRSGEQQKLPVEGLPGLIRASL